MKYLIVQTPDPSMRATIDGWSVEDSEASFHEQAVKGPDVAVGLIGGARSLLTYPKTVLHAIGQGWVIMAPPVQHPDGWEWWLTK